MAKYFNDEDFRCKCCGAGDDIMSPVLLERLDRLREIYGQPIYVSCGYRCPAHNEEVGGVFDSQHTKGTAADIWVDGNYAYFYGIVLNSELFDAVGRYPESEFVHVDVRQNGEATNAYLWDGE